ncbi:MAG TPA: CHAP domain-containing protein [Stenomitos sp.]
MDRIAAQRLMSKLLKPIFRPDQQYEVTPAARTLIDANHDGKIANEELLEGLVRDQVSFDPRVREIIANRSKLDLDRSITPKDKSAAFGTVEQCMEFVMRYYKESRAKAGLSGGSFDTDFGPQHSLADELRLMASDPSRKPGYSGFLNNGMTPPRAGDVLVAESADGEEFHIALVSEVNHRGSQWEVTVYEANVPFNTNSPRLEDHLHKYPLTNNNGTWEMPALPTSKQGYGNDMFVVGWIHPEGDKALPGAA